MDTPNQSMKRKRTGATKNPKKRKDVTKNELIADFNTIIEDPEKEDVKQFLDLSSKYPVLRNEELIKRFMSVPMNNNQKGRIRQTVKEFVMGAPENSLPDVINDKINQILEKPETLTDSELRKIRILYNMLKTATEKQKTVPREKYLKKETNVKKEIEQCEGNTVKEKKVIQDVSNDDKKNKNKVKGPKRYVVFVGNLPVEIDKEKIMQHFTDISNHIKDVRIPVRPEGNKSSIAYIELDNEASYELALSKHHSMFCNKRINVMYTTQKNGKISKTEAKGKAAKLVALQKAGKLLGSVPLNKKRSHRRAILRAARAREAKENK